MIGDVFDECYNLTLYVVEGSPAEDYAQENNINYKYIEEFIYENIAPWEFERKNGTFICADRTFSGDYGYYYRDDFFLEKNTGYNHHLATMSLCLTYSAYAAEGYGQNQDLNVKNLLRECCFSKYEQYHYNEDTEIDNVACVIASKKIEDTTIIAVAIRGGGYGKEWGSNFTVGESGDHDGFNNAANIVYERLEQYIKNKGITRKYKNMDHRV